MWRRTCRRRGTGRPPPPLLPGITVAVGCSVVSSREYTHFDVSSWGWKQHLCRSSNSANIPKLTPQGRHHFGRKTHQMMDKKYIRNRPKVDTSKLVYYHIVWSLDLPELDLDGFLTKMLRKLVVVTCETPGKHNRVCPPTERGAGCGADAAVDVAAVEPPAQSVDPPAR